MARGDLEGARWRATIIARRIRARADETIRERILSCEPPSWDHRNQLAIDEGAWRCVAETDSDPRLVFAHPDILVAVPASSLHYRGISLLSLKSVTGFVGSVAEWESRPERARVTAEKAREAARLYNWVISTIILDSTAWTLQDAYRNILATMAISEDGSMRNRKGRKAEADVQAKLASWLRATPELRADEMEEGRAWLLGAGEPVSMEFAAEPDIAFRRGDQLLATIEIKGGTDPAGALERLGAVKKSFDMTPPRTKNFLIAGVVTPAMEEELQKMRVDGVFRLDETLNDESRWAEFVNEVFHHALRLV